MATGKRNFGPLRMPTVQELFEIAKRRNLQLSADEVEALHEASQGVVSSFRRLDALEEPMPLLPTSPRLLGNPPLPSENKLGAWKWRTDIVASDKEKKSSLLEGYTVAIKDNVCVAGVPMSNGSLTLDGFVPTQDATLVRRILEAGGRILGKTVCEDLCASGGSFTSASGPVHNPYCFERTAGGSSSGSAAAVAVGDVDMAISCDQGGSIRIPACWCGVVGFKPSHGLVPYTGVFSVDPTIDHAGPCAKDVRKASLLLEAIAGQDGFDARQAVAGAPEFGSLNGLTDSLPKTREDAKKVIECVKFGVLREGFGIKNMSEEEVDASVRDVLKRVINDEGGTLVDVTVPWHKEGGYIHMMVTYEGTYCTQYSSGGQALGMKGHYMADMMRYHKRGMQTRASSLSWTNMYFLLLGEYIHANYGGEFYGRGQNLVRLLTKKYDDVLECECDVLVMPTLPYRAPLLPDPDSCNIKEYIHTALGMTSNTAPFNATGHPAVTLPTALIAHEGMAVKLPVGLMIVGRRMDDGKLMRIARAVELLRGDLHPVLDDKCS